MWDGFSGEKDRGDASYTRRKRWSTWAHACQFQRLIYLFSQTDTSVRPEPKREITYLSLQDPTLLSPLMSLPQVGVKANQDETPDQAARLPRLSSWRCDGIVRTWSAEHPHGSWLHLKGSNEALRGPSKCHRGHLAQRRTRLGRRLGALWGTTRTPTPIIPHFSTKYPSFLHERPPGDGGARRDTPLPSPQSRRHGTATHRLPG